MSVRALLVGNAADCDAGFVGECFRERGFAFAECHREAVGDWPTLDGIDVVVQLGSDWSVYWDHVAASVSAEQALVRVAHGRGTPVFGICFGAQVITSALGGVVQRAPEPEVGWLSVESSVPAVAAGPWMQWHYDRCEVLPPEAVLLATSPRANQVFQVGRTLAMQFHPEASKGVIDRWLYLGGERELERLGLSADELVASTAAAVVESRPNCDRLVEWFLDSVATEA